MPAPYAQTGILTNLFLNVRTLLNEPIFKGMIGSIIFEPIVKPRPKHVEDESVGDFVRRRFGPTITDNLLSALFHGIYAGDIYKLSARTLLPKLWFLETRDPEGSGIIVELAELRTKNEQIYSSSDFDTAQGITGSPFGAPGEQLPDLEMFKTLISTMPQQSVYTFTKGIGQLTSQLESQLRQNPNVKIIDNIEVSFMDRDASSGSVTVRSFGRPGDTSKKHDYVISTLPPSTLSKCHVIGPDPSPSPVAEAISDTATVMVVNLYYTNQNLTDPYRGFGYLIPQSIPMEQNPERALGVIFASETSGPRGPQTSSSTDLPTRWSTNHQDTAPGTKLTVMLGGHWWADWADSDLPIPSTAIEMAKTVLARHMGITETPVIAKAKLQRDAIPQYRVGHRKAMSRMHDELQWSHGRLRVAGPAWQGGVGVNDCVRKAWEVVEDLASGQDRDRDGEGWKTGIESYGREEKWVVLRKRRVSAEDAARSAESENRRVVEEMKRKVGRE
jgi:protoporphyrinogen/coproporphyrinogen III oxidase